ncbi:MAG: phosphotransferase [Deltaproteobacteria bacterium]|nr:phosphotransferase [Deltaproteobacteria bacterium]
MDAIIADLKNPSSLPDPTTSVDVVQTHISMVFVADEHAYKIKKPANFGFLDFSTLQKRAYYCERELELNRRLSKGIYLEVLPVQIEDGRHTLKGKSGQVVEYALKMKRIPEEDLMKSVFVRGRLTQTDLERIAQGLASFHLSAERSEMIDGFGHPERFRVNTDENFEQVAPYVNRTLSKDQFDDIRAWTDAFYEHHSTLFMDRIAQGKIRDCHGDLHMEHICLTDELAVIDCIEFNDRFRYSDTAADIAFLLMDLEYHGGEDFSRALWALYKSLAHEEDVESLLTFYKVYRAFVRGKVNSFQLDDPSIDPTQKEKGIETARRYFTLAHSYIS